MSRLLQGLIVVATCGCAITDSPWPAQVVGVDQMRITTPMRVSVLTRSPDKTRTSTVVLHVHVDAEGKPLRSRVEQSSGNGRLDEAALHAVREARFAPFRVDGVARSVTVVMPMHFPFHDRQR